MSSIFEYFSFNNPIPEDITMSKRTEKNTSVEETSPTEEVPEKTVLTISYMFRKAILYAVIAGLVALGAILVIANPKSSFWTSSETIHKEQEIVSWTVKLPLEHVPTDDKFLVSEEIIYKDISEEQEIASWTVKLPLEHVSTDDKFLVVEEVALNTEEISTISRSSEVTNLTTIKVSSLADLIPQNDEDLVLNFQEYSDLSESERFLASLMKNLIAGVVQ